MNFIKTFYLNYSYIKTKMKISIFDWVSKLTLYKKEF